MKTMLFAVVASFTLAGCMSDQGGTAGPEKADVVNWNQALGLVSECRVESAYQAHSGDVWLTLKYGTTVKTRAPALDQIVHELGKHPECGDVPIILE